jgi:hypothetical protein
MARYALTLDPAICLCLAYHPVNTVNKDTLPTQPVASLAEEILADVRDWCLEHDYELVCTQPDEDEKDIGKSIDFFFYI